VIVQAKNLTVRHGNTLAPDGVDLVATPGSVLGVVGRNGSGKPTLVKALACLAVGPSCESVPALDPAGPRRFVGLSRRLAFKLGALHTERPHARNC
jgi:energy-coupling factor transporter ATP-binding protein EcfA2